MSLRVEFHPLAALEVTDAERWYDQQRPGLGDRYLAAVNAAVNRAAQWPNTGTPVEFADDGTVSIRKVATAGFPYTIGYEVSEERSQSSPSSTNTAGRTTGPTAGAD